MASEQDNIWEKRLANQQFELIGSTTPGGGNGFHDRKSFDLKHDSSYRDNTEHDHWLYFVYFRDLLNSFDPQLQDRFHENLEYELTNCSQNYENTFKRYIAGTGYHYRSEIIDFLSQLSKWLINDGKVILEFISWFDNDDRSFYAFQLKRLPLKNVKEKRRTVIYNGEDESGRLKTVKIPKEKCVIINWPEKLGGFKSYSSTVAKILQLGSKLPSMEETASLEPEKILSRGKSWDQNFNRHVSSWGMMHPDKDLTEFYKEYNSLKVRRTGNLCMEAILGGLNQIIKKLNTILHEEAKLDARSDHYSIEKHQEISARWMNGKVSFATANKYIRS